MPGAFGDPRPSTGTSSGVDDRGKETTGGDDSHWEGLSLEEWEGGFMRDDKEHSMGLADQSVGVVFDGSMYGYTKSVYGI